MCAALAPRRRRCASQANSERPRARPAKESRTNHVDVEPDVWSRPAAILHPLALVWSGPSFGSADQLFDRDTGTVTLPSRYVLLTSFMTTGALTCSSRSGPASAKAANVLRLVLLWRLRDAGGQRHSGAEWPAASRRRVSLALEVLGAWPSYASTTMGRAFRTRSARTCSDRSTGLRALRTARGPDWGWRWSARSRADTVAMRGT